MGVVKASEIQNEFAELLNEYARIEKKHNSIVMRFKATEHKGKSGRKELKDIVFDLERLKNEIQKSQSKVFEAFKNAKFLNINRAQYAQLSAYLKHLDLNIQKQISTAKKLVKKLR